MPSLYPHANGILYALKDKGIDLAIASRSPTSDIAKTFIDKLGIKSMFAAQVRMRMEIQFTFLVQLSALNSQSISFVALWNEYSPFFLEQRYFPSSILYDPGTNEP